MRAWLRNVSVVEKWFVGLAVLTGISWMLLLIAVPAIRGEPLPEAWTLYAAYLMLASLGLCLVVPVLAVVDILRMAFSSRKRSR